MLLTRDVFDATLIYVAAFSLGTAVLMAWTVRRPFEGSAATVGEALQFGATTLFACLISMLATGDASGTAFGAAITGLVTLLLRLWLPKLTIAGAQEMALTPLSLIVITPWSYFLLADHGFPTWMLVFVLVSAVCSVVPLAFSFAAKLARQALLTHATWLRPSQALAPFASGSAPRVSIHVPAYAEPPEIVIAVLDRISRLDYPDFEVLVCDNNTEDEALWRPLEKHCERLNRLVGFERFRFFHVSPLAGAKAGALNFCLEQMDPDAKLVAVLDADYLAEPDFLSRLTGFFDDPHVGYVQTPHDYRGFASNAYLRACYWEYMPTNKIELPGINEYDAAFTIGTMCLLRADALRQVGRWAEWCLTEDSEVSVRIRDLGYNGVYLRETFGRGLIPETFEDYKKQRFRWTAGPVQQLRRHWRLYLPRSLGGRSGMTGWSKLLEVQRGASPVLPAFAILTSALGAVISMVLTARGVFPILILPAAFWVMVGLGIVGALVRRWMRYRLSGCHRLRDMLLGEMARLSLTYVETIGGVAGLSSRPLAWRRTPKFKVRGSGWRALASTLPETAIGLGHVALLWVPVGLGGILGAHFMTLVTAGVVISASRFLAAPCMALLNERSLRAHVPARPLIEAVAQPISR